jgi:hypothetical protein
MSGDVAIGMIGDPVDSPPDASGGSASVVEDSGAGCVQAASTPAPEAKARPTTVREFERALRDLGYSKSESAAIARSGFKAAATDADDDTDELEELAALLQRNVALLKD